MQQSSQNRGTEFLVPEYNLFDAGIFAIARKSYRKLELSGGLRYDVRTEHGKDLYLDDTGLPLPYPGEGATHRFAAFDERFSGVSGSLGATYQISGRFFTKANISRGFRSPNISEMGSDGIHEGTLRYELGNPGLKAEHSLQLDYSLGYNSEHVSADLDLFTNRINNYIFLAKLQNAEGSDSMVAGNSVFKYTAGNATLAGGEITIDVHPHPLDWLHFENSFSMVNAVQKDQPDSSRYLPMIPAAKFTSDIKATSGSLNRHLKNAFIKIGLDYYFRQNHFYAAYGTETATPAYALLNMNVGTDVYFNNKMIFTCIVSAENLLDEAYQSHLSRLKYAPENFATARNGVYDMGRNVGFKIIVPFSLSKASE